ncbi:hypothetical protein AWL63_19175 [Sphingomonas panacis]|uniref:Uncharacterized protein n=1 Tax=Sphingomonas panacis TaxID=1560345 RepID=A0A1B3ZE98_9SPHN|nr:hypothetical protein [Sphingomonas panacis]AOH85752.1 hypothetical protein AWL63_19175 [Sphingomonas panacis]
MSCRPDLYKARITLDRTLLELRDVERNVGGAAQLNVARAREYLAAADIELGRAVQLIAPPAVIFERLR